MAFMTYLARHHDHKQQQQKQQQQHNINKRSLTLPTVTSTHKKRNEIGDYVLCSTIGRGASGRVKLGIHKQTGEKVAIKMISRSHLTASTTTAKSVQRELAVLQLLHHPHLIHLKQVLQDTQYVYFVTEYLEGGELFHVLAERGRLPEAEARHLFTQLINALTWCHAHRISHRDLKPENILLDKEKKNLKIADFGMAAMQPLDSLLTTSCGSPHYASPEIVRGKRYDGTATDVWSCGAILYAMMTGHLPFDDENMGRLLAKIKTGRYRSLPDYLSSDAKDLIKRMLVVDPTKRMTMAEILVHPWLTNKSFLGTELKFLQQKPSSLEFDPLSDPQLQVPLISSRIDLDGRIWETLKVLWREKTDEQILTSLSTPGINIQKLTCKLLQERSFRLEAQQKHQQQQHQQQQQNTHHENHSSISLPPLRRASAIADDVLMTPPLRSMRHGSEDVESYILPTPYESSVDTMSCYRTTMELPLTPKSTTTFQQLIEATTSSTSSTHTVNNMDLKKKVLWDRFVDHNVDSFVNLPPSMLLQNNRPIISSSLLSTVTNNTARHHWIHDEGSLAQTEETRGSKADAADVFIMTKPIESTLISMHEHSNHSGSEKDIPSTSSTSSSRSAWWLSSKGNNSTTSHHQSQKQQQQQNWWDRTFQYFTKRMAPVVPHKMIAIECLSKHECETAGKLHQVLEECYQGKLSGRMYPHGRIVWSGTMVTKSQKLTFTCHMTKVIDSTPALQSKIKINFITSGQVENLEHFIVELLECLNKYEMESDWVTKTNGWIHPEIL